MTRVTSAQGRADRKMPGYGWRFSPRGYSDLLKSMTITPFKTPMVGQQLLTDKAKSQLNDTFAEAKIYFKYTTDLAQYSRPDLWRYPPRVQGYWRGDCEDFCILVRNELVKQGWAMSALRLCFCILPSREVRRGQSRGHMVLTADVYVDEPRTYVIDNQRVRVMDWLDYTDKMDWGLGRGDWRQPNGRFWSRERHGRMLWEIVDYPPEPPKSARSVWISPI